MTKTHSSDNELINTVKKLSRSVKPNWVDQDLENKVMASNSVFELADALHLGRAATRRRLMKVASLLSALVDERKTKKK